MPFLLPNGIPFRPFRWISFWGADQAGGVTAGEPPALLTGETNRSTDAKYAVRQPGIGCVVDLQIVAPVVQLNRVEPPDAASGASVELDKSGERRTVAGLLHGKESAAAG